MRQFDLSRHIPNYIDIGDKLHAINHQGKLEGKWLVIHVTYLNLWSTYIDQIFKE
jgi:hypothetical protein